MTKERKKKISFIIETLSNGGAERVTSLLANAFHEYNYEVNIIVLNKSDNEYLLNKEITKHYPKLSNSKNKLTRIWVKMKQINSLIKKQNTETIVSLATPQTNVFLFPSLLSVKKKVILSERNDPNMYPKSYILKKIRTILYMLSDEIVFQTFGAKDYFNNMIKNKGIIIPNPIKEDLPEIYEGTRKKEIVNFCRLDKQKNIPMLIDAFVLLLKEYPDYKLIIYGKGPLENDLKNYAKKYGNNKVFIKGYAKDIHEKIKDCEMFVSSSNYEGISNSMLESLAMGIPTICTDCPAGGARMIIEPYKNGLLVPVGDTESLYKAMKELIENKDLSNLISKNSLELKKELSTTKILEKWIKTIEKENIYGRIK